MATAEDYLNNAKWVKRVSEFFIQKDVNKNGYLTSEDFLAVVNNLAKVVPDRPDLISKAREAMVECAAAMGLTEGVKADLQTFLKLGAAIAVAEAARLKTGEKPLMEKVDNALFDILDKNHDGHVTWEEYKLMMEAGNFDPKAASATFALLDKNKNGKIERKELTDANAKFWTYLDDPDTQGLFGEKFE